MECVNINNEINFNEFDLRKSNYCISLEIDLLKDFEEKVLSSGLCDFTLPMQFTTNGNLKNAFYDCSGYTVVSDLKLDNTKYALEILEKTLLTLKKAKEYLIEEEKISLHTSTVYYHRKYRDVKIAYIPCSKETMIDKVTNYLNQLSLECNQQGREYLDRIKIAMYRDNMNLIDTINFIGDLRREAHQCGIN